MESSNNFVVQQPELSLNECIQIIGKKLNSTDFKIIDYKLIGFDSRNGFLGEHRQLMVTIEQNNAKTETVFCFAKFLPDNQAQIEFAINCGVFKKEVFVYEELFPKLKSFNIDYLKSIIPECYYTKENLLLVFDDITKKGFKPLSKYEYLDYNHVVVTLKSMAKLHASSLLYEEKMSKKNNKAYRLLDDYEKYFYETFYVDDPEHKGGQGVYAALKGLYTGLKLFSDETCDINNKQFQINVGKACLDIFHLVKPSKKYRNCLCHGDLWSTNIMIKYNNDTPVECIMYDFQTLRYCPPAHDFMSFIHLTTTRQFRNKNLKTLQRFYYDELDQLMKDHNCNLQTVVSFEEFLESCEEQKRFAVIQTATYVQLTQAKDIWIAEFIKDRKLWDEALYGDRSRMITENCKTDPEYRAVIGEALEDVKDICRVK